MRPGGTVSFLPRFSLCSNNNNIHYSITIAFCLEGRENCFLVDRNLIRTKIKWVVVASSVAHHINDGSALCLYRDWLDVVVCAPL